MRFTKGMRRAAAVSVAAVALVAAASTTASAQPLGELSEPGCEATVQQSGSYEALDPIINHGGCLFTITTPYNGQVYRSSSGVQSPWYWAGQGLYMCVQGPSGDSDCAWF